MEKEFIPYEQALALKDLGFDEPCFCVYNKHTFSIFMSNNNNINNQPKNSELSEVSISAPTYSQAFKWFREKYKLQHKIWSGKISSIFYGYDILNLEKQEFVVNNSDIGGGDCDYDTYEKAEVECLKKLIEIVKEEK